MPVRLPTTIGAIACMAMHRRLRVALLTGARAALLVTFANAALMVVVAAGLHDVNHLHTEETPEHVHALSEVYGPATGGVPPVALVRCEELVRAVRTPASSATVPAQAWSDCGVRDPPVVLLA